MPPKKERILQEIQSISKKWFTTRDDSIRLSNLLRELAHCDGYYSNSSSESERWFEERAYGLEEIARLESAEAVRLLVNLWKQAIGITGIEVVYLLSAMQHPAVLDGLKELARHGELEAVKEAAAEAIRKKSKR